MSAEDWYDADDDYVPLRPKIRPLRLKIRPLRPKIRVDGTAYAQDRDGNRVYPGDYVKCEVAGYLGLSRGERRRVISVSMDTLVMRNSYSPTGTSAYQPRNFTLAERHHAWHKSKEAKMAKNTLFIAVRTYADYANYDVMAAAHNEAGIGAEFQRSDTSFESLKAWLNQRIRANPEERWLILSGTTLAEISAPPVSFRPA